jgi:glutaredoxin
MNKKKLITPIVIVLMILLAGTIIYFKNFQPSSEVSEEVAKYIGNHSVLYVQTGCSHCKDQEDLFGENVKYLTIVNCFVESERQKCIDAEIEGTPTWVINGEKYVGVQSIEKLKELTGDK